MSYCDLLVKFGIFCLSRFVYFTQLILLRICEVMTVCYGTVSSCMTYWCWAKHISVITNWVPRCCNYYYSTGYQGVVI